MGYLTALWVASGVCAHFYEHQGHYLPVLGSLPALGSPWALLIWHCRATLTSITWEQPISLLALVLPCSHYVLVEKRRANQQQQISIKCAQELPEQALGIHWLKNLPPTYTSEFDYSHSVFKIGFTSITWFHKNLHIYHQGRAPILGGPSHSPGSPISKTR